MVDILSRPHVFVCVRERLEILSQRREKVCAIFICLFFLGVHFTAFGVFEHVMNAVSITETQSLFCVLFTFCIMSLNFHLSKKVLPAVLYLY